MRPVKFNTALLALLVAGLVPGAALAQRYNNPYGSQAPLEGHLYGQASLGQANAAMVLANAAVNKAVGDAIASNVKAVESLQMARGRRIENAVKATSNFYEKRKLYEAYQSLSEVERAKHEDLVRFSKSALPDRPDFLRLHRQPFDLRYQRAGAGSSLLVGVQSCQFAACAHAPQRDRARAAVRPGRLLRRVPAGRNRTAAPLL